MNKTQKGAWFTLVTGLLCFAIIIYTVIKIFILKSLPDGFGRFWPLAIFFLLVGISIFFMRKKQSPVEVESDERDNLIKKRAVLVSFVSVWVLLAAVCIVPPFIVGRDGSIPVWILSFMNVGVLLIALLFYNVAVLVQYGWGGKDGEK